MNVQALPSTSYQKGVVKLVLSGDCVVVRGIPKGGPPPERTIALSNIVAPKLARRPADGSATEAKDEPFAWEAREFLRKKLVGNEINFTVDYKAPSNREYGMIYFGKEPNVENIGESLIKEGLAEVRQGANRPGDDYLPHLNELQAAAKSSGKGKWAENAKDHVRDIKWTIENPRNFVDSHHQKPVPAVIEHVRDGSTVRAFLLPSFHYVTVMISGVRCPTAKFEGQSQTTEGEPFGEEAKFFTEVRLLQRDVEIVLETVANQNFVASVLHPNGNIAELLLKNGFAKCVDWSIAVVTGGPEKLRAAEKEAKEKRLRVWKEYESNVQQFEAGSKTFQAKVVEIVMGDALVIKKANNELQKIWLSSIRQPRQDDQPGKEGKENQNLARQFRPLYDIPYMFEAREFLRKRLIGKNVTITVDYKQAASGTFPERTCCTVVIGGQNVAEALVSKGLATVVRYKQNDENRSAHYDALLAAEAKAEKGKKGVHGLKKDEKGAVVAATKNGELPIVRVQELMGDVNRSKQFLPFLQRASRSEGVVEFVASGSRVRIYVPKETCLLTFLLAGISCARGSRPAGPGGAMVESEPYGDEALQFTKELCLQHEVEIEVDAVDKAGNFIGWLFIDGLNLSQTLVARGYASVHSTAERSKYFGILKQAEDEAKKQRLKIWQHYVETPTAEEVEKADEAAPERTPNYKKAVITEVLPGLRLYAQHIDEGPKLEHMMTELRADFEAQPPVVGAYTPRKGDLCAAKFSDGQWYRVRIESTKGRETADVFYVDFGNRETTPVSRLASLPSTYHGFAAGAHEYALAFVKAPNDADYAESAQSAFRHELAAAGPQIRLCEEYRVGGLPHVSIFTGGEASAAGGSSNAEDASVDVGKRLVSEGFLMAELRRERRLAPLVAEYVKAQEEAKKARLNIWRYGDFTGDEL